MDSLLKSKRRVYNINITDIRGEASLELNIDFSLVRSQKLLLIPQLKQALEILGMSSNELFGYVEEQMEANPLLEIVTEEKPAYAGDAEDTDESTDNEAPLIMTLKEHLLLQLDSLNLDKTQMAVGEYLIDNTDENGYMNADICEVSAFFNIPAARVGKVLSLLQSLDPPGICARNLKECLLIQLKQMENVNNDAVLIVEKHLDKLADNDFEAVSMETGLDAARVDAAIKLIRTLEPRPGREFYGNEETQTVIEDVTIRKLKDKYEVLINEEAFPDINIVESYKLEENFRADAEAAKFIKDKSSNAVWLIKCMEQRKDIILKISGCILKEQQEFFEKGPAFLKPASMEQLAEELNMHVSILSEALNGKYLHCRWGLYEMSRFFE